MGVNIDQKKCQAIVKKTGLKCTNQAVVESDETHEMVLCHVHKSHLKSMDEKLKRDKTASTTSRKGEEAPIDGKIDGPVEHADREEDDHHAAERIQSRIDKEHEAEIGQASFHKNEGNYIRYSSRSRSLTVFACRIAALVTEIIQAINYSKINHFQSFKYFLISRSHF